MSREILAKILEYTNIGYLNITASIVGKGLDIETRNAFIDERLNPKRYLSKLVDNPTELLQMMDKYGIVLSGSRAAAYFTPGMCTEESDWDFYTSSNGDKIIKFIEYLLSIGICFDSFGDTKSTYAGLYVMNGPEHASTLDCIINMHTRRHTKQRIQIIVCTLSSIHDTIYAFNISALQCIITGRYAVSLYHKLTRDGRAIRWGEHEISILEMNLKKMESEFHDDIIHNMKWRIQNKKDWMRKYDDRALEYITYSAYSEMYPTIPKVRHLRDLGSNVIKFEEYKASDRRHLDTMIWEDFIGRPRNINTVSGMYPSYQSVGPLAKIDRLYCILHSGFLTERDDIDSERVEEDKGILYNLFIRKCNEMPL